MTVSPMHDRLVARLCELFGEPANTLGKDSHWALRPGPDGIAINILVNGSASAPIVWVFDPYEASNTLRETMVTLEGVDAMISTIQKRLERAASPESHPGPA